MIAIAAEWRTAAIGQRAVVLDQALQRFPGQIQAVEIRVAALQRGDDAQGLGIVIETAERGEAGIKRALASVAERRMAEVVGERQRLGEVFVETKPAGERAGYLCHFERMCEPRAVVIAFVENEDLGLVLEAAERGRMDDAVAVAAEGAAALARGLGVEPATAIGRIAGITGARRCSCHGCKLNRPQCGPAGN